MTAKQLKAKLVTIEQAETETRQLFDRAQIALREADIRILQLMAQKQLLLDLLKGAALVLLLLWPTPALAQPQGAKAPLMILEIPMLAPMGKAGAIFIEHGRDPMQTAYTPAEGDYVSIYQYMTSLGSPANITGLWGYNTVLHSKGRDVGLSGIEVDIQTEAGPTSLIPFASVGGTSKTGVTSVLGPSLFDGSAAFASTVNLPTAWGDRRWRYGFWSAGNRVAAFISARHTNQNGWIDPQNDYFSDTNASCLMCSVGSHQVLLHNKNVTVSNRGLQFGSFDNGPNGGAFVEAGRNVNGAAGVFVPINASGVPGFLWMDRARCLRFGTGQPNALLPWTDTYSSIVLGCLP